MPKINIRVSLHHEEFSTIKEIKGIYQDGVLKYIEDENIKVSLDYKNKTLLRDTNNLRMFFDFNKNLLKINYKELDMNMEMKIKTEKIIIDKKNIEIEYEVEDSQEIFLYRIEELKWVY